MYNKEFDLDIDLIALANYVQDTANRENDIGDTIIYSAGMEVKMDGGSKTRSFGVQNTDIEGRVKLQAKGEGRAAYIWEYSLNQEEWEQASVTTQAATIIDGLRPGKL